MAWGAAWSSLWGASFGDGDEPTPTPTPAASLTWGSNPWQRQRDRQLRQFNLQHGSVVTAFAALLASGEIR